MISHKIIYILKSKVYFMQTYIQIDSAGMDEAPGLLVYYFCPLLPQSTKPLCVLIVATLRRGLQNALVRQSLGIYRNLVQSFHFNMLPMQTLIALQLVTLKKKPLLILTYRLNHPSMNRLHDAIYDSPEVVFLS